jgi:aspartate carbamoyltransferase catalytic subunit
MHPGPINVELRLAYEVADSGQSVILNQAGNGVAIRMAVIYLWLLKFNSLLKNFVN